VPAHRTERILEEPMTREWDDVTRAEVLRAIQEYALAPVISRAARPVPYECSGI
jgi:hypothetical protein